MYTPLTRYCGGGIFNRTYGTLKKLRILLFLVTIFGRIYYMVPRNSRGYGLAIRYTLLTYW